MKTLSTFVFGAAALLFANFATAAPAAASDAGFGVSIQVGHYDDDYGYQYNHRRCWSRWYRRHHPYECDRGLRQRAHYGWGHRRHWRQRDHDGYWYWHRRHYPRCRDRRGFHDHDVY
jgi:hypothetical protein